MPSRVRVEVTGSLRFSGARAMEWLKYHYRRGLKGGWYRLAIAAHVPLRLRNHADIPRCWKLMKAYRQDYFPGVHLTVTRERRGERFSAPEGQNNVFGTVRARAVVAPRQPARVRYAVAPPPRIDVNDWARNVFNAPAQVVAVPEPIRINPVDPMNVLAGQLYGNPVVGANWQMAEQQVVRQAQPEFERFYPDLEAFDLVEI